MDVPEPHYEVPVHGRNWDFGALQLGEYVYHYNGHRPHRSLGPGAPEPCETTRELPTDVGPSTLRRTNRLGGLIHEYRLVA